jgi:putative ATP-binding cassette transporter
VTTTLATIWRLAAPYFRSDESTPGRILLATVIAIELGVVAITVLINRWNNDFYNALQERDWDTFVRQMIYFCVLAALFILLKVYQLYLNQWLQIRWRRWMTHAYLGHWLEDSNHYRMQLLGDAADNPDQRIAEDIRQFVDWTLRIGLGFLNSVVTLLSFVIILWGLSQAAPLHLFGLAWSIPGYLVWAALIYSVAGTLITHFIGRPLIRLLFNQQRYEADFRFNLVRTRENSEQIALLNGEDAERGRLNERFGRVADNWHLIMSRQKKLTFFTAGFDQASVVVPYLMVSPAYFAGVVQLGALMQTASAFNSVQGALSFFVLTYNQLAEWTAVIQRLAGFNSATAAARALRAGQPIAPAREEKTRAIVLEDLKLELPGGAPLASAERIAFAPNEDVLLSGPSGSGKSTLFRAISGVWPFGQGKIALPTDARIMVLPQRPYFPTGTLAEAATYPATPGSYSPAQLSEALEAVGLGDLVARLGEEGHWNRTLSIGEQQRLAIARAILQAPDFLFLDEATASLDEPAEAAIYQLLRKRLSETTIISIGHRSTLKAFHKKQLAMRPEGGIHRLAAEAPKAAAE